MRHLKRLSLPFILSYLFFTMPTALANPEPHPDHLPQGATVHQSGNTTTIYQTSQEAILHWKSFNVHPEEHTHFQQPQGGIALNRIDPSGGISFINGKLTATGQIVLINGAGIHFGPRAYVNVGGIIASTLDISNQNFLARKFVFNGPGQAGAKIVNHGQIRAEKHGLVAFVGPHIENHGYIEAQLGTVALGAGDKVTMGFGQHNDLIHFVVEEEKHSPQKKVVINEGRVYVHHKDVHQVLDQVVNMKGVAVGTHVSAHNGKIIIHGGSGGYVRVKGKLNARNKHGGEIRIRGKQIEVKHAEIYADGQQGGGDISIGQPRVEPHERYDIAPTIILNPVETTQLSIQNTTISAAALEEGNGGHISLNSARDLKIDEDVHVYATGGSEQGHGGIVQISSPNLNLDGFTTDTTALAGGVGELVIEAQNMILRKNGSYPKISGDMPASYLDTDRLSNNLNRANLTLVAMPAEAGVLPLDIKIEDPIIWEQKTSLTLSSPRNIYFDYRGEMLNAHSVDLKFYMNNAGARNGELVFVRSRAAQVRIGSGTLVSPAVELNPAAPLARKPSLSSSSSDSSYIKVEEDTYSHSSSGYLNLKEDTFSSGYINLNEDTFSRSDSGYINLNDDSFSQADSGYLNLNEDAFSQVGSDYSIVASPHKVLSDWSPASSEINLRDELNRIFDNLDSYVPSASPAIASEDSVSSLSSSELGSDSPSSLSSSLSSLTSSDESSVSSPSLSSSDSYMSIYSIDYPAPAFMPAVILAPAAFAPLVEQVALPSLPLSSVQQTAKSKWAAAKWEPRLSAFYPKDPEAEEEPLWRIEAD